jgi:death-on-curing protein
METFLVLDSHEIKAAIDEQQTVLLSVAASELKREAFLAWLREHIVPLS